MSVLGLMDIPLTIYNNLEARSRTNYDRERNFELNELAANNADKRTRALYEDYYSPAALLRQYNEAGLSPSLMFGGTPGQGGTSGAQSAGTAGPQSPYMPMSILEAAQASALIAQTKKTNAETKKTEEETKGQEIQNAIQDMQKKLSSIDFNMATSYIVNDDGTYSSLFDYARDFAGYGESGYNTFKNVIETITKEKDPKMYETIKTEQGNEKLRNIFMKAKKFDFNIQLLTEGELSSKFQQSIVKAMNDSAFAEKNAEAAVKYLEQNIEASELSKTQKQAWNNLIAKLGDGTTKDIIVVLGMILNQAMCNWHMPSITNQNNYKTTNYIQ